MMFMQKTYKIPVVVRQLNETTYEVTITTPGDRRRVVRSMTTVQSSSADEALWTALDMVRETE